MPDKFPKDDDRELITPGERGAWTRFAAAAFPASREAVGLRESAEDAGSCADALMAELRKRDHTHDGSV